MVVCPPVTTPVILEAVVKPSGIPGSASAPAPLPIILVSFAPKANKTLSALITLAAGNRPSDSDGATQRILFITVPPGAAALYLG